MGGRHSKSYRVEAEETPERAQGSIRRTGSRPELATQLQQSSKSSEKEDFTMISTTLCKVDDLKDGEMKDFTVEGKKILLVKDKGQFHAVGGKCTHYGANLATGVYSNGRVRCPWHGACFSVVTGDIEDFPGLDSLPKFQTKVEDNSVILTATKEELDAVKRTRTMCATATDSNEAPVIIVGGGAAASTCAESLRHNGFHGDILMLTQESSAPYDRIKLSKAPDTPVDKILLRTAEFYDKHNIRILTNSMVTSVSVVDKAVTLADQDTMHYSKLVIATGGTPRLLTCPGADLGGVFYLRTPEDGLRISGAVQGRDVVVIGSSFIGMELAAFLSGRSRSVTVIGTAPEPFPAFGPAIGGAVRKLFESKGVQFKLKSGLASLLGENGHVTHAVLADGSQLPADAILVGIGVVPATDFLKNSGIAMNERGFIPVDGTMKTNAEDVYAAGDIVMFPLDTLDLESVNVQHWQMAHKHGNVAGAAIAGKPTRIHTVPFFWTMVFGKSVRYSGYGAGYDDVIIHGNPDDLQFVAYYLKNEKVIAVASMGRDPICSLFAEIFHHKKAITKADVEGNPNDIWTHVLST